MKDTIKVSYIEHMGSDLTVVNSARISFNKESQVLEEKDEKLIEYLAKNEHLSPFEHCTLSVLVECPLFIRSQIHRHRTFAYNEVSRRYTADGIEFYVPPVDDIRSQSKSNKQASEGPIDEESAMLALKKIEDHCNWSEILFRDLLSLGVAREQARMILPQNLMTKFWMTGNLRNWIHFVRLRDHAHAQKEARDMAQLVKGILVTHFPISTCALLKYQSKT